MQGFFITSNNTGSGKTFMSCQIIQSIKNSYNLKVYKPLETDCELIENKLYPKDAHLLNSANDNKQDIDEVCPYKFSFCGSGEIASGEKNITTDDLIININGEFNLVEGAGGFYSPLLKNTLNSDFAKALNLPVVIVIKDELGCISETLLTIDAVKNCGLKIFCVVLNQIEKNNLENAKNLQKYTDEKIIIFNNSDDFQNKFKVLC